jgi:hypothetical protein
MGRIVSREVNSHGGYVWQQVRQNGAHADCLLPSIGRTLRIVAVCVSHALSDDHDFLGLLLELLFAARCGPGSWPMSFSPAMSKRTDRCGSSALKTAIRIMTARPSNLTSSLGGPAMHCSHCCQRPSDCPPWAHMTCHSELQIVARLVRV